MMAEVIHMNRNALIVFLIVAGMFVATMLGGCDEDRRWPHDNKNQPSTCTTMCRE
jgi:hypothetical protein